MDIFTENELYKYGPCTSYKTPLLLLKFTSQSIRLFGKSFSFANVFFTTVHLYTNVKPSL